MESRPVIIVGAGAAGLAAAARLSEHEIPSVILEAADRVGGRIYTQVFTSGLPVELGAEFVHGLPPQSMQLIHRAGLAHMEWKGKDFLVTGGRYRTVESLWDEVDNLNSSLAKSTRRSKQDISWGDALDQSRYAQAKKQKLAFARNFMEGFHGADPSKLSMRSLKQMDRYSEKIDSDRAFLILGGYQSLLAVMGPPPKIRFQTKVNKIEWKNREVKISAENPGGAIEESCRAVIITVPLPVLSKLEFVPALEEKKKAISGLAMGEVTKITFEFSESFWREETRLINSPGADFSTWWTQSPIRSPQIVAWAGNRVTQSFAGFSDEQIVDRALDSAASIFKIDRKKLKSNFVRANYHNWSQDPHSQGSYSYVTAGGLPSQKKLAQPIEKTLYFAGEACHWLGNHATVDGAIETGIWAADSLKRDFA